MLTVDTLTADLILLANKAPTEQALAPLLPADDEEPRWQLLNADEQPTIEMQVSPTFPFRRQTEPRLLAVDVTAEPMTPQDGTSLCKHDLRADKDMLVALAKDPSIRFARLGPLAGTSDAVIIARSAEDLRKYALLLWLFSPRIDADGNPRQTPLEAEDIKAKAAIFNKRAEELGEREILQRVTGTFTRDGDLFIIDWLNNDGGYDFAKATEGLLALAALDSFSHIPGAPQSGGDAPQANTSAKPAQEKSATDAPKEKKPPTMPKVVVKNIAEKPWIVFLEGGFTPNAAASLGNSDYGTILGAAEVDGRTRDTIFEHGADFVAPVEFLSEVFFDGKPLSKGVFESEAQAAGDGRMLQVMYPRYGAVTLLEQGAKRYVFSSAGGIEHAKELLG